MLLDFQERVASCGVFEQVMFPVVVPPIFRLRVLGSRVRVWDEVPSPPPARGVAHAVGASVSTMAKAISRDKNFRAVCFMCIPSFLISGSHPVFLPVMGTHYQKIVNGRYRSCIIFASFWLQFRVMPRRTASLFFKTHFPPGRFPRKRENFQNKSEWLPVREAVRIKRPRSTA